MRWTSRFLGAGSCPIAVGTPCSGPRTQGGTHLVPGRWGCGHALQGRLRTGCPQGPGMKLGRCGAQSGSSAPRGHWQPGHRNGCSEAGTASLEELPGPIPLLPLLRVGVGGAPCTLTVPSSAVPSTFPLVLPSAICGGKQITERLWGKGPGFSLHQKWGVHSLSAHILGILGG